MNVRVLQIHPSNPPRVSFFSACGTGEANWSGPLPSVDTWCEVELDLDDEFRWGHNLRPTQRHNASLNVQADGLHLCAELVALEGDGTAVLNLHGSIVLISLHPHTEAHTGWVELVAQDLTLHGVEL